MTVFSPARVAGRLALGDEARIVLDPAPDYGGAGNRLLRRRRGAVHTEIGGDGADEREKLMFRVKLSHRAGTASSEYEDRVKTARARGGLCARQPTC